MADLRRGALVAISGPPTAARPWPEVGEDGEEAAPLDLSGERAQLVRFEREADRWIAATFNGRMVAVGAEFLRPLSAGELGSFDFVLGPGSDAELLSEGLASTLSEQGYALMRLLISGEDSREMLAAAARLEGEDYFSRMAVEFERGYLGVDGVAKTMLLDPSASSAPDFVRQSPLAIMDENFARLSEMLDPHTIDTLGFRIHGRSQMLLQLPLAEAEEDRYPSPLTDDKDAEGYMQVMVRKKLTLLFFVGPTTGTVTLLPCSESETKVELQAEPGALLFLTSGRYEHSYQPDGEALALSTFLLAEPPFFSFTSATLGGDLQVLGMLGAGPPPPPMEQCYIPGMYCRYGTGAEGRDQFWCGVAKASTDGLTKVPIARFDMDPYFDPNQSFGGSYTQHGCFGIEGCTLFDNKFFEISPAEAKGMDPCQRQVMEVSYMALLEGGYDKRFLQKNSQNIGHFVGIDKDDWMCMASAGVLDLSGAHGAAAASNSITANRFSYSLNLKGASMTIDTACSSSLVCTHVSKLHLRAKVGIEEMPASVVNGLNMLLYQGPFVGCSAAGMLSHEGRSFTFNATADGYARGELCGALIFKVGDSMADPDTLALLAGSQANQDGRSASLSAPNGPAQEKCINAVLREAALTPTEVDTFECHGTGTSLGDPIEVGAFRKVMSYTPRLEPMVITSSKSNIAHGEGGAGLAGFFKCCMQVMHCEGAANVHLRAKNPHLDMEGFPCQILNESVTMREDSAYSGVSSFGFGGTNAHGEAFGRNIMTSRSAINQDPQVAFQKKLARAPPAEITMTGDDVMEWETTGPDPRAEPGTKWKVDLDEDGTVTWERDDDFDKDYGDEFFLQGTFNGWHREPMERHAQIPGLWVGHLQVGSDGEDLFQVVADENEEMVYHPEFARCSLKAPRVCGPERAGKDLAWLVRGEEGTVFRIEFFQQDQHISILWIKE